LFSRYLSGDFFTADFVDLIDLMNESIVFTECPEDLAKEIWYYGASLDNSVKLLLCHSLVRLYRYSANLILLFFRITNLINLRSKFLMQ
jgi:hypothetical protein